MNDVKNSINLDCGQSGYWAGNNIDTDGIDTLLLSAGVTLWATLSLNPVHSPWLGTKLLLLVVYILLGSLALKRAPTPATRRLSFAAALCVYLFMASVAVTHHPLGVVHTLGGQGA